MARIVHTDTDSKQNDSVIWHISSMYFDLESILNSRNAWNLVFFKTQQPSCTVENLLTYFCIPEETRLSSLEPQKSWMEDDCAQYIDPLGQPTVTAGRDHCFRTCLPFVRAYVPSVPPHFSKYSKTKQSKNNVRYWRDCGSG